MKNDKLIFDSISSINNDEPHEVIIVTRHKALVEWLHKHHKFKPNDVIKVIEHATRKDIDEKDVIGVLPLNLACFANSVTQVDLDLPLEMRGKELTVEDIDKYYDGETTYYVQRSETVYRL